MNRLINKDKTPKTKYIMNRVHSLLTLICVVLLLLPSKAFSRIPSVSNVLRPTLLPVPQNISLSNEQYSLDESWSISVLGDLENNDPAVSSLISELKNRFGLQMKGIGNGHSKTIQLKIKSGSVAIGATIDTNRTSLLAQAYKINLNSTGITIEANAGAGLFYGVQTLIQMIQKNNDQLSYPSGEILDWPSLNLRMIYWDDAHHLERVTALKKAIKKASYYKINAITIKLEGHFKFISAKPIVEPYAYSKAEFQDLTDYARAHHVELIPYIDAPAHVAFILKHPEFKALRAFSDSNYQFSVVNPKTDELLLGMFDDLFEANKGGKYVYLSTDEAYYTGKSVEEKEPAAKLGGNGRLLTEFVNRIADKLRAKGRTVFIWAELPMTIGDITSLSSHIVNGVYNDEWAAKIKQHGMRQMIYTSTQGVEPLFPNYHNLAPEKYSTKVDQLKLTDDEMAQGDRSRGRVGSLVHEISTAIDAGKADFMGVVVAAWADAGLNPESFWLGYATGNAIAWNQQSRDAQDLTNRFYNSFYGTKVVEMDKVYQLLSTQAIFWDKSWDWVESNLRPPIFGNSEKVFNPKQPVKDQTLPDLIVPSGNLTLAKDWNVINKTRLQHTKSFLKDNDELLNLLDENISLTDYEHYNLLVLRSIAQLCRQNLNMMLDLSETNDLLKLSSQIAKQNPVLALSLVDKALDMVSRIHKERNQVLQSTASIWYQDWYPLVSKANGRTLLHQVDDVKDHPPVRTVDLSYLIYRQLNYPIDKWTKNVLNARNQFAKNNKLSTRTNILDWKNLKL